MSLNYDPTAYETWRQNYEMREALAWFGGCIWYFMWGNFMGANRGYAWVRTLLRGHGHHEFSTCRAALPHDASACRNAFALHRL